MNAALSITRLLSLSDVKPRIFKWVGNPIISIIGSTLITKTLFSMMGAKFNQSAAIVLYIIVVLCIYVGFLFVTGTVNSSQIKNYRVYIKKGLSR